ncbi:hypothetical protein ROHU_009047 [Labeo rohita]|uniref:Uncharacterized protein n=1 Tax=Labeo rohita TaxID=84645 RepID=A0A498M5P1_LABRO|nr:hypothetical protein ROHU_009047 [Labeo rohita]
MAGVLEFQEDVASHMRNPQTEVSQGKGAIAQNLDPLLILKGQTGGLMLEGLTGGGLMLKDQSRGGLMLKGSTLKAKAWLMHMDKCLPRSLPKPQALV